MNVTVIMGSSAPVTGGAVDSSVLRDCVERPIHDCQDLNYDRPWRMWEERIGAK